MTLERRLRLIKLARRRGDTAAIAILQAGRRYQPDPAPLRFVVKALRPLEQAA
jgi:hypothetical protein